MKTIFAVLQRRRRHIQIVWHTFSPRYKHSTSLHNLPLCPSHTLIKSIVLYTEYIFCSSGLGGNWAPHLNRISATINLSTTFFLSLEVRKKVWLTLWDLQFCNTSGSHCSIRHVKDRHKSVQIAEKQSGLFFSLLLKLKEDNLCVCVCVCARMYVHVPVLWQ